MEPSWTASGGLLGRIEAILGRLRAVSGRLEAISGPFGLTPFWVLLGLFWKHAFARGDRESRARFLDIRAQAKEAHRAIGREGIGGVRGRDQEDEKEGGEEEEGGEETAAGSRVRTKGRGRGGGEDPHRAAPWNHPEATPGPHIGTILKHLGAKLKPYWAILWDLGDIVLLLAPSWAPRGAVLDHSRTDV